MYIHMYICGIYFMYAVGAVGSRLVHISDICVCNIHMIYIILYIYYSLVHACIESM